MTRIERIHADLFQFLSVMIRNISVISVQLARSRGKRHVTRMTRIERIHADLFQFLSAMIRKISVISVQLVRPPIRRTLNNLFKAGQSMLQTGSSAPIFSLHQLDEAVWRLESGRPTLLVFFETDCPTCLLLIPYLNRLAQALDGKAEIVGISQDDASSTRELIARAPIKFPVVLDRDLMVTREYDPQAVPTLFLINVGGKIARTSVAFDKDELNAIASEMCAETGVEPFELASRFDGAPQTKPGCVSRHLEPDQAPSNNEGNSASSVNIYAECGPRASRIELDHGVDPYEFCYEAGFADPLPVIPPTAERVDRMLDATLLPPEQIIARVPPNYGMATVEKIAANAVMAGCQPGMMRVLIPLIRAACDERFNIHGVQATTHFAAPLVIVNGPVRHDLRFACGATYSATSRERTRHSVERFS